MHTLKELKSGCLKDVKHIKIAEGLTSFPNELFELKDTLEILDLSGNKLQELPENFGAFSKLKIVFFANNEFEVFPKVLAECSSLTMIGFKSNRLKEIPEHAFPSSLQWLILTDNQLNSLPESIGACKLLQKAAFAGNQIEKLPDSMAQCHNLELLRISANQLKVYPDWLFKLPKLSWLAFAGNTCSTERSEQQLEAISVREIEFQEVLGEGASGTISRALWRGQKEIAVKVFKGEVTSDGYPDDEMKTCISAGNHSHLVPLLGELIDHEKQGLLLGLIDKSYKVLGKPPSFETCTRDILKDTEILSTEIGIKILNGVATAVNHLHEKGIMHGDLYAHNILFNLEGNAYLGDFGAASFYDKEQFPNCEKLDVRAFGCLMEDIQQIMNRKPSEGYFQLMQNCLQDEPQFRPGFQELIEKLRLL
jgi:hypothetical protein